MKLPDLDSNRSKRKQARGINIFTPDLNKRHHRRAKRRKATALKLLEISCRTASMINFTKSGAVAYW